MSEQRPGDLFQQKRNSGGSGGMRRGGGGSGRSLYDSGSGGGGGGGGGYNQSPHSYGRNRNSGHGDYDRDYDRDDRDRGGGGGSFRGGRRTSSRQNLNLHSMPCEEGRIHTLLDNFGFIYCANRPSDIFFHYSELKGPGNMHSDDLKIGDEVKFHVGASKTNGRGSSSSGRGRGEDPEQLSAYHVAVLEPGTVKWEVEDEPVGVRKRGKVDRMIRYNNRDSGRRNDNSPPEGTIRLILDEEEVAQDNGNGKGDEPQNSIDQKEQSQDTVPKGASSPSKKKDGIVRFVADDDPGLRSNKRSGSLDRNDLVEFTVVTNLRSGLKYARNITLIQSERARLEEERERKLLENAPLEQGIIISLKNGFGFVRSNSRREEVYFHFSHMEFPVSDKSETAEGEKDDIPKNGRDLKVGQELEFRVVTESDPRDRGGVRKKESARKITFLEKGTVVFEQLLASGVRGVLSMGLKFPNVHSGRRNNNKAADLENPGKIKLCKPIHIVADAGEEDSEAIEISHASLYSAECRDLMKDDPKLEVWFRVGDTLLFDVVRSIVDGDCRAVPTTRSAPGHSAESGNENGKARIKLLAPSLAGRAEGTVASIRDNFGFVQLAHRNIDVYFRLNEIFPNSIQQDFVDTVPALNSNLVVGSEVSFDLSLLPPKSRQGRNSRNSRRGEEKEQLRAQRLVVLPAGSIKLVKVEEEVTGAVMQMNRYNAFAGQIRLTKKIKGMCQEERYPLVTKMIRRFLSDHHENIIHFPDVLSESENDIILDALQGKSSLDVRFTPVSDFIGHRGRISIYKVEQEHPAENASLDQKEDPVGDDTTLNESILGVDEDAPVVQDSANTNEVQVNVDDAEPDKIGNETAGDAAPKSAKKSLKKKAKALKAISFDRQSLSKEYVADPPMNGDEVTLTATFHRSTGTFIASNMTLVKRHAVVVEKTDLPEKAIKYNLCEGYVLLEPVHTSFKEIKSSRRRGFSFDGGSWESKEKDRDLKSKSNEDGIIFLLDDPAGIYRTRSASMCVSDIVQEKEVTTESNVPDGESTKFDLSSTPEDSFKGEVEPSTSGLSSEETSKDTVKELAALKIDNSRPIKKISYTESSIGCRNPPKRGDLVTFARGKGGKAKDVKVKTRMAVTKVKGILTILNVEMGSAVFVSDSNKEHINVDLSDVVGCAGRHLQEGIAVEGILHDGKMLGISRAADLYLKSAVISGGAKERPKLNLTVRKGLGGKIIAQTGMAKGPDGTNGFQNGWTSRQSKYAQTLNVTAVEFTPSFMTDVVEGENEGDVPEESRAKNEVEDVGCNNSSLSCEDKEELE
mmetsp:Transcript_17532/g.25698  ORF Transcript_17532/g.25698 Transcript_17532/m.25698 type:complete len:1304 (+) Transcript_17532:117-4028(+)